MLYNSPKSAYRFIAFDRDSFRTQGRFHLRDFRRVYLDRANFGEFPITTFSMSQRGSDSAGDVDEEEVPKRPKTKQHGRSRSIAGIHGIAAGNPQKPATLIAVPTTLDIRKARQLAARSRALIACLPCKIARYVTDHY